MGIVHRRSNDRGAALVETALVLPLLILLIFGLIEFGRGYNAKVTLTHATREGVRVLAITGDPGQAETATRNAVNPLDSTQVSISTTTCTPGEQTSLTASYPFAYTIPLFGSNTITIETTAVMRCGG